MADGDDGSGDGGDGAFTKGLDISKLKTAGADPSAGNEKLRKIMEHVERPLQPFRGLEAALAPKVRGVVVAQEAMKRALGPLHDPDTGLAPEMKGVAAAQEAIKRSLGPLHDLQDRMKSVGIAAGPDSTLGRLAEQIGAQQSAIEAMRVQDRDTFRMPELPHIPPNPIHETNKRLERIEKRFEQMQGVANSAAEIATGLQGAAAEFLQKFEKAAASNDRSASRAIRIGAIAVIIAVAMPAAPIIYSEYRREPSNGAEIQAALEEVRAELSTMREAQAEASDRLNEALTTFDSETTAVLRDIRELLAQGAGSSPAPVAEEPPQ